MRLDRLSEVKTGRCRQTLLSFLYSSSIENLICLKVVSEHLLKLVIDLLVQVEQLSVRNVENTLCILLAEDLLNLFVQVSDAHQV